MGVILYGNYGKYSSVLFGNNSGGTGIPSTPSIVPFEDKGISNGTITIDISFKHAERYTLNSNNNIIIGTTPPADQTGIYTLELVNGGDYVITWDQKISFADGYPPVLSGGGTIDRLIFICEDGINLQCFIVGLSISRI